MSDPFLETEFDTCHTRNNILWFLGVCFWDLIVLYVLTAQRDKNKNISFKDLWNTPIVSENFTTWQVARDKKM